MSGTNSNLLYLKLVMQLYCFFLKFRSALRNSKNYSEFEVMPAEENYDATSHLGEAFQSKSVVNSFQV